MLSKLVGLSVRHRIAVVLLTLLVAGFGVTQLFRLPIDAVPDITNKQVQVTTIAPALSPEEIEQQVTFPVETALGGVPGLLETRSISRNGFSQITAVFQDNTDIYFARQQVNERTESVREDLPAGARPEMAPSRTAQSGWVRRSISAMEARPPEAMTGIETARASPRVIGKLRPLRMPSRAMSV